jgi:hypothetical protein
MKKRLARHAARDTVICAQWWEEITKIILFACERLSENILPRIVSARTACVRTTTKKDEPINFLS